MKLVTGAFALFALLAALPATAEEDEKTYPGMMCISPTKSASVFVDNAAAVANRGTTTQVVVCPIIKDAGNAPTSIEYARIFTTSLGTTCGLYTRTIYGDVRESATPNSITPYGTRAYALAFAVGSGNVGGSYYYSFVCRMAANSRIIAYEVTENNGED